MVTADNTKLVAPKDVPKRWEDLLDPKWKGKVAFLPEEYEWYASFQKVVGHERGLDFMHRFPQQGLQYLGGHAQIVQLMAAGEFPFLAVAFAPRVSVTMDRRALVDWVALGPVFSMPVGMGVYKWAPHLNAAKLYIDFMLSKETQPEIWVNDAWTGSARQDVTPKDPRWQEIKVLPLDLNLAQNYKEIAREFQQIFNPDPMGH